MTVLDTFYFLFKTDSSQAKADMAALDKQVAELAKKGKDRTVEESKLLDELRKKRLDTTRDIKDQTREVDKLGGSLGGLLATIAGAGLAFGAFSFIKAGVLDVTNFNSGLQILSQRTNQSTQSLREFDAVFQAAGGQRGSGLQLYDAIFKSQAAARLTTGDPKTLITRLRNALLFNTDGLSGDDRAQAIEHNAQILGISDQSQIALLSGPIENLNKAIEAAANNAKLSEEAAQKARAFEAQEAETQTALETAYTNLATDVLPAVTIGLQGLANVLSFINKYLPHLAADSVLAPLTAGSSLGSRAGNAIVNWFKGTPENPTLSKDNYSAVGDSGTSRNNNPGNIKYGPFAQKHGATGQDSRGFAIFPDEASGEAALQSLLGIYGKTGRNTIDSIVNSYTSGDSKAIQDAYKATLARASGHGIYDQLNLSDPSTVSALMQGILHQEGNFHPLDTASSSPLTSAGVSNSYAGDSSYSIKIDELHVNTQATDATGISQGIGSALTNEFRNAFSNIDNGVLG